MKKVILGFALAALIISCKKETKEKVEGATEAVGTEMKQDVDTMKVKTETAMDTAKAKVGTAMEKEAKKMGKEGKEMKEEAKKK